MTGFELPLQTRLVLTTKRSACLCFPHKCWDQRLGPPPLLAFLLVNITKNAQLVACKEIRVSPAQTNAGKCFRAKTRRKTNQKFEVSDIVGGCFNGSGGKGKHHF